MDFINAWLVIRGADNRQCPTDGYGTKCARCCERMVDAKRHSNNIARTPIALGGRRNIENFIVVCDDCLKALKIYDSKAIPFSELPCYKV